MAKYIKATKAVADYLGVTADRNRTADGNYLLWQADVARFPGDTISERAAYAGGVDLSAQAARQETDGTDHPAKTTLPQWLQPTDEETTEEETTADETTADDEPATGKEDNL